MDALSSYVFSIDEKHKPILDKLKNYFDMDNKKIFIFAMSLGYLAPTESLKKSTYVRGSYFNATEDRVPLILSYLKKNMDLENLNNDKEIMQKAEESVNRGLDYLSEIFIGKNELELDEFFLDELSKEFDKIEAKLDPLQNLN